MLGLVILLVIVGASGALLIVLLVRAVAAPRRIGALAKLLKQGRTRQVIAGAKRILARDPRSTDARYLMELAYLKEDRPELALIEMRAINESGLFTDFCREPEFRRQAAGLYDRFGHPNEALKEYLLLMKAVPEEADYAFRVGELFEKRGDTEKAAGFYARAVKLEPGHAEAHARLGCLHYRAKRPTEAKRSLEVAVRLDPGNATACYYLGRLLKEGGDTREALKMLERAARDATLKARALLEAGSCSLSSGDYVRAVADLSRALKASPGEDGNTILYVRYFLGLAYEKARDFEKAVEQWELVHAVKSTFRDVAEKLAEYRGLDQDDGMKDYLTAGAAEFGAVCRRMMESVGLEVTGARDIRDGCEIEGIDPPSGMVQRRLSHLIRFLRGSKALDEGSVRTFFDRMRSLKADRGLIVAPSGFTKRAVEFAQTRPLELADSDKLQVLLKRRRPG